MKIIENGGVTSAIGFSAAGTAAGIKYQGRMDMAMIFSEKQFNVAGTFTKNVVKAAPVIWDRDIVRAKGLAQAVVVNSGIANACTGEQGLKYCRESAECAAKLLSINADDVLVGSTGVIGMQLRMEALKKGINDLAAKLKSDQEAGNQAARAIMTTDTHPKEVAVSIEIDGKTVTVGGMSKGSGMIHPNMCTMLAYVTTDADIDGKLLQELVSENVEDTFNMISVDGDTSTNDTLLVMANGMAGNKKICEKDENYNKFKEALNFVNTNLAKMMAADGEGATALFEVEVVGADNVKNAKILAKSVITSSLTKAAIFGHDANWGRILCALGYSGVEFDPDKIELWFESAAGKMLIFKDGVQADYSEEEASRILSEKAVHVTADMKMGDAKATAWGCDLTYDYVKINADYRS